MSLAGRRKLAEGREAEIFEWNEGTVLKLFRGRTPSADRESTALATVATAGGPAPRLIDRVEIDGRAGLVIERIEARDMLAILERAPTRLVGEARRLAETQVAIHRIVAAPELQDTRSLLREAISDGPLASELRAFALGVLETLPEGDRLIHGDFHPGNVLVGDAATVIDWTAATRGHPLVDVARTRLLLDMGRPLAPSAWMRAVIRLGRGAFSRLYLRRYAQLSALDGGLLDRAKPVVAAARLREGVEGEEEELTSIVAAARRMRDA